VESQKAGNEAVRLIAFAALSEPSVAPLDPPRDRVFILDPIRGDSILQRLQNTVERPRARCYAIVNREAYVGSTQEQLAVPLSNGREPGLIPIDHAGLDGKTHLLRCDIERRIDTRLVAMADDDVAAVAGNQPPENSGGEVRARPLPCLRSLRYACPHGSGGVVGWQVPVHDADVPAQFIIVDGRFVEAVPGI
jgi:hypothetical protein